MKRFKTTAAFVLTAILTLTGLPLGSLGVETVLAAKGVTVDEKNFPDANFRACVSEYCDINGDGVLSEKEIRQVKYLRVSDKDIRTLKGIEYFSELEELQCRNNRLTKLDLSNQTALKALNCSVNQLTTLDLQKNTALVELNCEDNHLSVLDLTKNPALAFLDCAYNRLERLNVSKNRSLMSIHCISNRLDALDLSGNPALQYLNAYNNRFKEVDVSAQDPEELYVGLGSNGWTVTLDKDKKVVYFDGVYQPTEEEKALWNGNGTVDDPYLIRNAKELKALAESVNRGYDYRNCWFRLTEDIDLSDVCGASIGSWEPIGTGEDLQDKHITASFCGNLDGNGKTIKNLYIKEDVTDTEMSRYGESQGLFGSLGMGEATQVRRWGVVKDLTVDGEIRYTDSLKEGSWGATIGGIAGQAGCFDFLNCTNRCNITSEVSEGAPICAGGICASANGGCNFTNCVNTGSIKLLGGENRAGGIMGYGDDGWCRGCKNTGRIEATGRWDEIGGIAARADVIKSCENSGDISGTGSVGGIAVSSFCENCYNTGNLTADSVEGAYYSGIAGGIVATSTDYSMRRTDYNIKTGVFNCYNIGTLGGTGTYLGEIIGYIVQGQGAWSEEQTANVGVDCYYLGSGGRGIGGKHEITGDFNDETKALDEQDFSQESNFHGWDFSRVWKMEKHKTPDFTRPVLRPYTDTEATPDVTIRIGDEVKLKAKGKVKKIVVSLDGIVMTRAKKKNVFVTGFSEGTVMITAYDKKDRRIGEWIVKVIK